ncbi:MAG: sugar phosphate isomerase/epimerase [Kiritimatiellaeota bacterium]|nr:sugar phosphate isomerase/epimerase [Kiritimatiellota bacterium]
MGDVSRRAFLKTTAVAAAGVAAGQVVVSSTVQAAAQVPAKKESAAMKIGCFALVEPFATMARQFKAISEMGIKYADITDNHQGGMLGVEYGFSASISLDIHPAKIRAMVADAGLELTAFCAHANLLDPASPDIYSTNEIIKAIRLAKDLGIRHVITTEGDPKTEFGHKLTPAERLFSIKAKLYTPVQWAEELGVELLLEPHGIVTDSVDGMAAILDALGHEQTVGICLDTGNSWLGGGEPVDYIKKFGKRIKHVHWKDMSKDMEKNRGKMFGCGMAVIPLGDGVVGIPEVVKALKKIGFDGATTLEIAGPDNVKKSAQRLREWWGA